MRRYLSSTSVAAQMRAHAKRVQKKAMDRSEAPPSVGAIPDNFFKATPDDAAVVRMVGCTRRILLRKPNLSQPQLEGLAYRIQALSKNEGINSVLIGTDTSTVDDEDGNYLDGGDAFATSMYELDDELYFQERARLRDITGPRPGYMWHMSSGYDPLELYTSGDYLNADAVQKQLTSLTALAKACRGSPRTRIPIISFAHGACRDGGYAFLWGSYVLATNQANFRIVNPLRGLSLDPVGLSFLLPRLGHEFKQPSRRFPGCGMLLALAGYQADPQDMMETGLATNYVGEDNYTGLIAQLERILGEFEPWNQQALIKNKVRYHGDPEPRTDHNAEYRNYQVAELIHCITEYRADGAEPWTLDTIDGQDPESLFQGDPSLIPDPTPMIGYRYSRLVDIAASLEDVFSKVFARQGATTLREIVERLKELAAAPRGDIIVQTKHNEEDFSLPQVCGELVQSMERASPLALSVTYRLLQAGAQPGETADSCMAREARVQRKLYAPPQGHGDSDFERWAKYARKQEGGGDSSMHLDFAGRWRHDSIAQVTNDEVEELFAEE